MPAKPIDTAVVDIVPNLTKFAPALDREITRALSGVGVAVDRVTHDITAQFNQVNRDTQRAFEGVARSADRSLEKVGVGVGETTTDITNQFQHAGERAEDAFQELALTAGRQLNKVDAHVNATAADMGKKFSIAGLAIQGALFGVGAAAVAGLGALAKMGLSSAANLEQVQISFNALLGGVEQGTKVFKELQLFAAQTPFEFPDVASAGKRFLAFAGSVGLSKDALIDYLTTIGNVISVTGGGADAFGRISLAIGQIGSASKVTLDNLNQIADAIPGFSPIQAIAKSLGISTAEAMKQVSAGTVSAQQGVAALLQGMRRFPGAAGAMEKQSQTLLGVFSTFKDTVGQALAGAFAPVIPKIKNTLTNLTPVIGDALGSVAPALGNVLAGILPLIGSLVKGITPILTPILNALGPAFEALAPALQPLGAALGQIIVPLTPLLPLIANLAVSLIELLVPILQLLGIVLKPLTPLLNFLALAVGEFAKWLATIDWGKVGTAILHGFVIAWHAVVNFFKAIGSFFSDLPENIASFAKSLPTRLGNLFKSLFDMWLKSIGVGFGLLVFAVTQLPGMLISALWGLNKQFGAWFLRTLATVRDGAIQIFLDIVAWTATLPTKIMNAITSLPSLLITFFINMLVRAKKIVVGAVDAIVGFFHDLPHRLIGFTASVGLGVVNFIKGFLNHAIDAINSGIAKVDSFVPGDLPRLPRLAHGGIAFGPALIGENPGTAPEAAIPLGDPHALALLRSALGTGGPSVTFEAGSINIHVDGSMTTKQAHQVGQTIGVAIADSLNRTGIKTAVRMAS
jgi:tape measure domain-containing protein